jgi:hypothetical protein
LRHHDWLAADQFKATSNTPFKELARIQRGDNGAVGAQFRAVLGGNSAIDVAKRARARRLRQQLG